MIKPLIVGEVNEKGGKPLFPYPANGSGGRLCKILGLPPLEYMFTFDRVNLCTATWNPIAARMVAQGLMRRPRTFILLGAEVTAAFGFPFTPFVVMHDPYSKYAMLPHPSGRCRIWNDPIAAQKARVCLVNAGIKLDWRNS